jgi:cytidine deaminase
VSPPAHPADLLRRASVAAAHAYAPYSGFRVGAVVVADDGREFTGVNVENAAFPSTLCAESSTIAAAAAAGVRKVDTVAVACLDGDSCVPCGNCRQVMREFGVEWVVLADSDGNPEVVPLASLLPRSFGPEALPDRD